MDNSYFSYGLNFTEPDGSLPCLEDTASTPYTVPDGTIQTFTSFFFKIHFIVTLLELVKIFIREKRHNEMSSLLTK